MRCMIGRLCSACQVEIEIEEQIFVCRNCSNGHVLCQPCMVGPEDDLLLQPSKCRHGIYEDMESYEPCVSATYTWMNKDKPEKRCSTCKQENKPTRGKPMYYCKGCWLHRICTNCWKKEELRKIEKEGEDGKNDVRASRRRTKVA